MPLSWNEIRSRAFEFANEWADEKSEHAEAKSFWDGFFNVFGISRKRIASFEVPVKKSENQGGFIDLFWKGVLIVEHKSRGKDLDKAYTQALDYFPGIKERDLPQYVLVSDFERFRLYDLDPPHHPLAHSLTTGGGTLAPPPSFQGGGRGVVYDFTLSEFPQKISLFGFIAGYQTRSFGQQDPVNVQAAEKLGKLHDQFKATGYDGHALEILLVRLLFCLFAEDTALFERDLFQDYLTQRTSEDGSDLGMHLAKFFQVLDTPPEKRLKTLDEQLAAFPYINGQLFTEVLPIADCDRAMRETLLDCCALDWSRISPAIFGSLFQSIMDTTARRNLGAHYTSETNILKLIRPLFLDDLWAEFEKIKRNRNQLFEFLKKLSTLNFFDPACGCGNFLVIAYRELRLLELEVLRHVRQNDQLMLDVFQLVGVNVDQFHGIEIEEWPARIAEVALWLTDHQMNLKVSEEFGLYFARLPLKKAPHIVHGNALRIDWNEVVPAWRLSYLLGNPPFVGKKEQGAEQKTDLQTVFGDMKGAGVLDYVACWYRKAAEYMAGIVGARHASPLQNHVRAAFVSTNSITQGEQVGILWPDLLRRGVRINFAHRTFQWNSEARGKAAVHCVIIGFSLTQKSKKLSSPNVSIGDPDFQSRGEACLAPAGFPITPSGMTPVESEKWLFDYDTPKSEPHAIKATNINPYLVDAPDILVEKRTTPVFSDIEICKGSEATDFGHLVFSSEEKTLLCAIEPNAEKWLKRYAGGEELINSIERWCLWLVGIQPHELKLLPTVMKRVELVRKERLASGKARTREWAANPTLFSENRQPASSYLAIPKVSSERRNFIPIAFLPQEFIASGSLLVIPNATIYHFGILASTMHNAWMRAVCGRMKSDYQYSAGIVYNNFPWPEIPLNPPFSKGDLKGSPLYKRGAGGDFTTAIETAAQAVLDARAKFPNSTLADLYDPLTMPPELVKAHQALDRAVDAAYLRRDAKSCVSTNAKSCVSTNITTFKTESERVAFLFERYQQLVAPLVGIGEKTKGKKRKS